MAGTRTQARIYRRPEGPGGTYYIDFWKDGKRVRRSLETTVLKEAKERRDAIIEGKAVLKWGRGAKDITPADFWKQYTEWAKLHKTRRTREIEELNWIQFLAFVKPKRLGNVTRDDVQRLKQHLLKVRGQANRTVNDALSRLQALYNRAVKMGVYAKQNPFTDFGKLPTITKPVRFLSPDQIDAVLEAADRHSPGVHLFCSLAVLAGLRYAEAVNARWEWVNFEQRFITVQAAKDGSFVPKGKRHRTIPLNKRLSTILENYREPDGYLITSERKSEGKHRYRVNVKRAYGAVVCAAGVPWASPHILRHSFASRLVQEGVDLFKVGQWLGHANPKTTMIYAHLRPHDSDIDRI